MSARGRRTLIAAAAVLLLAGALQLWAWTSEHRAVIGPTSSPEVFVFVVIAALLAYIADGPAVVFFAVPVVAELALMVAQHRAHPESLGSLRFHGTAAAVVALTMAVLALFAYRSTRRPRRAPTDRSGSGSGFEM